MVAAACGPATSLDRALRGGRRRARRQAAEGVLELARARATADLAAATQPAHRAMLEAAIAALEDQIRSQ